MARIRTIKPEFWSDATICELSIFTTLFYVGLWNFADDAGRGRARAKELNGLLFGGRDNIDVSQVEEALQELADRGRILLYTADGMRLFQIVKWWQHQKIDKPTASRFPAPEGFSEPKSAPTGELSENSPKPLRIVAEAYPTPSGTEDGRRKTEDGTGSRKLEDGNGTTEGGLGETVTPAASVPSVRSFGTSASSVQSVPEPAHPQPPSPPPNRPPEWRLSEADIKSLCKDGWTRQQIEWGIEIGIECGTVPRNAKSVLHASILPDVREGARPERISKPPPPPPRTGIVEISEEEAERLGAEIEARRALARSVVEKNAAKGGVYADRASGRTTKPA